MIGVALAAGGAGITWMARARRAVRVTSSGVESQASFNELKRLDTEVASLRLEIAGLKQSVQRPLADPTASGTASSTEPPATTPPPLSVEDAYQAKLVELDSAVESEPLDRSWSTETQDQIEQTFRGGIAPGSDVTSARCGSTVCRVRIHHSNGISKVELSAKIATTPPFNVGTYYAPGDNENETILYVLRNALTAQ